MFQTSNDNKQLPRFFSDRHIFLCGSNALHSTQSFFQNTKKQLHNRVTLKISRMQANKRENRSQSIESFVQTSRKKIEKTWQVTSCHLSNFCTIAASQFVTARSNATRLIKKAPLPIAVSDEYLRGAGDIFAATVIFSAAIYLTRAGIRRYPTADHIPRYLIRKQATLHGCVVSVRDGDGLRIRHAPFFYRLFNKYMSPRNRNISSSTISVRLAGVDAPECASFSKSGQYYGPIARDWLKNFALGEKVSLKLHSIDHYKRVIATVHRKHRNPILRSLGIGKKNVSLELTKAGYATLYEGAGAQYGSEKLKRAYMKAERIAKGKRIGMWADRNYISPAQHKSAARNGTLKSLSSKSKSKKDQPIKHETANGDIEMRSETVGRLASVVFESVSKLYRFLRQYR